MDLRYDVQRKLVISHFSQYPKAQLPDLIKLLYQSELGSGHMISDPSESLQRLLAEYSTCKGDGEAHLLYDPIGNGLCRLHLEAGARQGLSPHTLHRFFLSTAQVSHGSPDSLRHSLACLPALAKEGLLPFSPADVHRQVEAYIASGCPPLHHSQVYRAAYRPKYRVVYLLYAAYLPLFLAIDEALSKKDRVVLAIDGDSGAGKSTLAQHLASIYDCNLLHMDDFFLPQERKTADRLSVPGGNVDYERFLAEAEAGLLAGTPFFYQKYDCSLQQLTERISVLSKPLTVIEGVYSLHPALSHLSDIKVLLQVDPQAQARRILQRNGPQMQKRFLHEWIPLEKLYFSSFHPEQLCDFVFSALPEDWAPTAPSRA